MRQFRPACHAIDISRQAYQRLPDNLDFIASALANTAILRQVRFAAFGDREDLDGAIAALLEAIECARVDHPDRATMLQNLATGYARRFDAFGSFADLDAALGTLQSVAAPPWENYGYWEAVIYVRQKRALATQSVADLDDTIQIINQVLATPRGVLPTFVRARMGQLLGITYSNRFISSNDGDDLRRAIDALEAALQAAEPGSEVRIEAGNSLGTSLVGRYRMQGNTQDLDRAIELLRATSDQLEGRSYLAPLIWLHLGSAPFIRAISPSVRPHDYDEAVRTLQRGLSAPPLAPRQIGARKSRQSLSDARRMGASRGRLYLRHRCYGDALPAAACSVRPRRLRNQGCTLHSRCNAHPKRLARESRSTTTTLERRMSV